MSKHERKRAGASGRLVSRRAVLECSAIGGGAALAAGLVGGLVRVVEAGEQSNQREGRAAAAGGTMRRVISGHNAQGKSYIAGDELVDANDLWRTDAERPLGAGPTAERAPQFRPTGASRCFVAAIQPSSDPKPNLENRIGFHRTGGVAYCYILTGEIVFLTDLQEVRLKAGDLLVERGTDHSWRNEGTAPVAMLITVVAAAT